MRLAICSAAILTILLTANAEAGGLATGLPEGESQVSDKDQVPKDKKSQRCDVKKDKSCIVDWQLTHTGFPEAIETLRATKKDGTLKGGEGIIVAHMDTGLVDYRNPKSPDLSKESIDVNLLHPRLPKTQIILTDPKGQRLPLNFYSDRQNRATGCFANKFKEEPGEQSLARFAPADVSQPECGPRPQSAMIAPRDFFDFKVPLIGGLLVQHGHATGTMSALFQAAPGVSVVPYKFTGGVILTQGRTSQLADALVSAALEDRLGTPSRAVDIITISLGRRSPAPELDRAARLAEQRGIIVVAAAGQIPGINGSHTRFPAQFASVIAVTGTRVDLTPWAEAGRGPRNAVAAPAVDVWRSSWEQEKDGTLIPTIGRGTGTSFAAPLVAAAAALWIEFHGREDLEKTYGKAGVASAFRYVLLRTARTPKEVCDDLLKGKPEWDEICQSPSSTWDQSRWGFGILAADKILDEPLPTRWQVCKDVYRSRGAEDLETICPERPGDADPRNALFQKPVYVPNRAKNTWVNSVAFGNAFGLGATMVPSVTVGVIRSGYESQAPRGWFSQVEVGRAASFKVGTGYASTLEYSPKGHSERTEIGKFPGFGPAIGFGIRAAYMRRRAEVITGEKVRFSGQNFGGLELQLSVYRFRVQYGYFWPMGRGGGGHKAWSLGWGF